MTVQKVNGGFRFGPVPRSDIPQTVQKRKLNGWQLLTDAQNLKNDGMLACPDRQPSRQKFKKPTSKMLSLAKAAFANIAVGLCAF